MRHVGPTGRTAAATEVLLRALEVVLAEHAQADAGAHRRPGVTANRDAVVSALLKPAQVEHAIRRFSRHEAEHVAIEGAARREITRGEHDMARARDVEWRLVVGGRQRHAVILLGLISLPSFGPRPEEPERSEGVSKDGQR